MTKQQLITIIGILSGFFVSCGFAMWYLFTKGEFTWKKSGDNERHLD